MTPLEGALVVIGFLAILLTSAALLMGLEMLVPGLSRWLDEHVGPEPDWRSWK